MLDGQRQNFRHFIGVIFLEELFDFPVQGCTRFDQKQNFAAFFPFIFPAIMRFEPRNETDTGRRFFFEKYSGKLPGLP